MTHPHQEAPSLHECQIALRNLVGAVGQGVRELRKAREKWADLIKTHEVAVADRKRELSTAVEKARAKAKAIPREDKKRQTVDDLNAIVEAEVADEQHALDVELAVIRHAKRMEAAEIKQLEEENDRKASDRAIWKALLDAAMLELNLAGVPGPTHRTRPRPA